MEMLQDLKTELSQTALAASASMPSVLLHGESRCSSASAAGAHLSLMTSLGTYRSPHLPALHQVPFVTQKMLQPGALPHLTACIYAVGPPFA